MGVAAGALDRRIQLQRKNRTIKTSGAEGGPWVKIAVVPARVQTVTGRESFAAQQRYAEVDTIFTVRFRKGYDPIDRVVFANREYDVQAILEVPGGRPEHLEILTKARAEQ